MSKVSAPGHHTPLIEADSFPYEFISTLAERESWRKEVNRPIYHIHKWWANRLGSVFRGIILACLLPEGESFEKAFYQKHNFQDSSVFDPFMGSGTTIGEAHKLGCIALGRDINPVACESVRVAFGPLDRRHLQDAFLRLSTTVGKQILELYRSEDEGGQPCDVLYYFWVKMVPCLHCGADVDLFTTYIFARNAYPTRKPEVQVFCPRCGNIFTALHTDRLVRCSECNFGFNPHTGPASRLEATCQKCHESFSISRAVRDLGRPLEHRLYAKLVLTPEGSKRYLRASAKDSEAYRHCSSLLNVELEQGSVRLPDGTLSDGNNTSQAIAYNYNSWRDFFNDRQLLALAWLQRAIAELPDDSTREALLVLFSGVLEFNNLFATYKGEGTGAVRHMFSHHILKPERMPIEANVWGTPKSSGSFTNLFKSRLLRVLDYRDAPFEVTTKESRKVHLSSGPFSGDIDVNWPLKTPFSPRSLYLSCGSSRKTSLPDHSVDFVITDPPFFDNVHYSELADFFFAWQSLYPHGFIKPASTTRHPDEVQDTDSDRFASKLQAVFAECHRVLKDDGLLAFTYHHSRAEGWTSLAEAVFGAGFSVTNAHPVKAEMSVSAPKSQAKEPIQLDIILVCKKRELDKRIPVESSKLLEEARRRAHLKLTRLSSIGIRPSRNDCRVVLIGQILSTIGPVAPNVAVRLLEDLRPSIEQAIGELQTTINMACEARSSGHDPTMRTSQASMF